MRSAPAPLAAKIDEVMMSALMPCDLGDGIEVVHDVESVEVELECALDDDDEDGDEGTADKTLEMEMFHDLHDEDPDGTTPFLRMTAPYERIEIEIDESGFRRATIEEAKRALRSARWLRGRRRR
jgi:hypothetical protein